MKHSSCIAYYGLAPRIQCQVGTVKLQFLNRTISLVTVEYTSNHLHAAPFVYAPHFTSVTRCPVKLRLENLGDLLWRVATYVQERATQCNKVDTHVVDPGAAL